MKNTSVSIPVDMVTKKFYCHKCGEQLSRHAKTRTLSPGDPDYREHNRIGRGVRMIGDVEVTEYDFQCPACGNIIEYREQSVIRKIQKQVQRNVLSEGEIAANRREAEKAIDRKNKVNKVIGIVIFLIILGLVFYMKAKSGDFSFKFYF